MNFFKPTKVSMMIFCFILFLSLRALLDWTCTEYYRVSPEYSPAIARAIIPLIFPENSKNTPSVTYDSCWLFGGTPLLPDVITNSLLVIIFGAGYVVTSILYVAGLPMFYGDGWAPFTLLGISTTGIISLVLWYFLSCLASSLWYKLKERNVSRQNPP